MGGRTPSGGPLPGKVGGSDESQRAGAHCARHGGDESKGILAADELAAPSRSVSTASSWNPPRRTAVPTARCCSRRRARQIPSAASSCMTKPFARRPRTACRSRDYLTKLGVIPGIKVDTGAKPLAGFPNETITEGLDGLRERLQEYPQARRPLRQVARGHRHRRTAFRRSSPSTPMRMRWPVTPRSARKTASFRSSSRKC